jgi:hypothetical protein
MRRSQLAGFATSIAACVALAGAASASAAPANAAAYTAQVNAICRSFTPTLKQVESDMLKAKRAGDQHRYGYDLGVMLALTLKEGLRVEQTPVPADARAKMATPLRQLHAVDLALRRTIAAAVQADAQAFTLEAKKLATVGAPLNRSFDAAGLRDCGSNQQ